MKAMTFAVVSACAVAAVTGSAARASAEPSPPQIGYSLRLDGGSVEITIDKGTLAATDGRLEVRNTDGNPVTSFPLTYRRDDLIHPIAAAVHPTSARLTPDTDPRNAVPATVPARDIAIDPQSTAFNTAVMNFATQSALGVALGTLIGTAVGAAIGCVAGGLLVGAATTVPTIGVLAVPGFLGGCLVTGAAAGAIGAVFGTVLVGLPVTAVAAWWFFDALRVQATS